MNKTVNIKDPAVIRRIGFDALVRELGTVGAINFIQQYDRGSGDYTKDRRKYFDDMSVDEITDAISLMDKNKPK